MTGAPAAILPGVSTAVVRDWMTVYGGADRTMLAALELFPAAPIHTLVHRPESFRDTSIAQHPVETSFLQHWPGASRHHRWYLPLMPLAVEQFDLRRHDLVLSMSHAVAKGALTRADQLHVSYLFTPSRYAWDLYFEHLGRFGAYSPRGWAARCLLHYLRLWDRTTAERVDVFVASSRTVARRIWKTYRRPAEVIYPPVDVDRFEAGEPRDDYYLTVSRLVPYKRVRLIAAACRRLRRRLVVIGEGPERAAVEHAGGDWVETLGHQPDDVVRDYLQRCRAFLFAADEDFGIAPIEAQAAGAPVIAYGRGGATETVIANLSGLFFHEPRVESLTAAIEHYESMSDCFHPEQIRLTTHRFSRDRFQQQLAALLEREWGHFRTHDAHEHREPRSRAS
jgi:glycosyltransferase involved in cell wall biosynthesis